MTKTFFYASPRPSYEGQVEVIRQAHADAAILSPSIALQGRYPTDKKALKASSLLSFL